MKPFVISAFLLLTTPLLHAQNNPPEIIYIHANFLTGAHLRPNDLSKTPAKVTAIAVSQGKITAVGTDANLLKLQAPSTKVIDLNGAFAMPGFNDAHTHIASAGQQKLTIDLDGTKSLDEMQRRIKTFASTTKSGTWLQGAGWDHTLWPSKTLPTRADIDAVTQGHPAVFTRTDGHIVIANTAALAAAGITSKTPDPPGAKIDRDASGEPTGIVREGPALAIIYKVIPPPTSEERRRALEVAIADANANGVTSVQDFSDWEDFLVLEDLERTGNLHLRVSEWLSFDLPVATLKKLQASHSNSDLFLHTTMLKGFMDGSLGSRTAALNAPYSDDPGNSGIPRYDQAKLNAMTKERVEAGFQIGFHAIGDHANHMALEALALFSPCGYHPNSACSTGGGTTDYPWGTRPRIEHAQVLLPQDFERFHLEQIIASMQPSHLLTDMNWAEARLGPDRVKYSYAWRSFLDHNVVLAFGTDYPVESINPFRGLYAAITRQNEAGTRTYQPQEKITLNEAIYAYTQASAFAENQEKLKGRLEPDYVADFVVFDHDITSPTLTPQELLHTQVLRTVLNGEIIYSSKDAR
ncbi:MAG TPA: amidohydrolase [Edaphobacter sp.]|nr:amidohydrolase [Edaphobacter sp.]